MSPHLLPRCQALISNLSSKTPAKLLSGLAVDEVFLRTFMNNSSLPPSAGQERRQNGGGDGRSVPESCRCAGFRRGSHTHHRWWHGWRRKAVQEVGGSGAERGASAVSPCLLLFIRLLSRLRQQAGVHPPPSLLPPHRPPHPTSIRALRFITRGEILHYCQSECAAVTLEHIMQSLMH